jgi:hypothetical protein
VSTHASIVIRDMHGEICLYRHSDGYPAECGADVAEIAARAFTGVGYVPTTCDVVNDFLRQLYPAEPNRAARPVYELSDGQDSVEEFYVVDLTERTIGHAHRPSWDSDEYDEEDWAATPQRYTVAEFVAFVNRERTAANERIAELKRAEPQNERVQQMQPMSMVSV